MSKAYDPNEDVEPDENGAEAPDEKVPAEEEFSDNDPVEEESPL